MFHSSYFTSEGCGSCRKIINIPGWQVDKRRIDRFQPQALVLHPKWWHSGGREEEQGLLILGYKPLYVKSGLLMASSYKIEQHLSICGLDMDHPHRHSSEGKDHPLSMALKDAF